ncbi:Avirulence (Avh) protein [Phytophthora megakarya]|uniref:RxLR effector protein n=1 Tax=Phytophthora megakarya TaxID=4795 RepID=A0A225UNY9_9STRA|nr:Avirulence (Avh) protein [Phytophthora megakarya]
MRFAYFFAVIFATTLHASGMVFPVTKDSEITTENVAAPAIADTAQVDGRRQLRPVEKYTADEDEIEEERLFNRLFRWWKRKKATNWKGEEDMVNTANKKSRDNNVA